jgi:hypothetical protein
MRWNRIATAIAVTVLATACANQPAPPPAKPVIHMSRVDSFDSVAEMRAASTAVVHVTAGSAQPADLHDVSMTVTEVSVDKVVAGTMLNTKLRITQFGSPEVSSPDTSKLLVKGHRYLLFVKPYVISGVDTGQFLITGDQGAYELTSGRYELTGASGAKIPATLPVTGFPAGVLAP